MGLLFNTIIMKYIEKSVLENAYSYDTYRQLIDELMAKNKTTGEDHSEVMLNYTRLNLSRMNRLDKKSRLTDFTLKELATIQGPMTWLVITEGWCGDAAQIVPVLNHMALENRNITLRFILRDQHEAIIDAFLTNNARSIPKVILVDTETSKVLGSWGPRPADVQKLVMEGKVEALATDDMTERVAINTKTAEQLHLWYAKNKTKEIQAEFLEQVLSSI